MARIETPQPSVQPLIQPAEIARPWAGLPEISATNAAPVIDNSGSSADFLQEARELLALGLARARETRAAVPESAEESARTSVDADVIEPVPLATLPIRPPVDASVDQIGVLELLIDEQGTVETARLVGNTHFRDRWLISAAKAWRFKPATKNGQPVRFLKRIAFQRQP